MQKIIVSDTSCLILLQKLQQLNLLKELFGKIIITKEVEDEFMEICLIFFKFSIQKILIIIRYSALFLIKVKQVLLLLPWSWRIAF
jgi:predicted nucleic acid-binding protein